jgi:hypothetical protein
MGPGVFVFCGKLDLVSFYKEIKMLRVFSSGIMVDFAQYRQVGVWNWLEDGWGRIRLIDYG